MSFLDLVAFYFLVSDESLCSRMILRLKLLENLKEEVIQDLGEQIMADLPFEDIPLEIPSAEQMDKPLTGGMMTLIIAF